jgi:AAA family ATP:ADP antiporter
VPAIDSPPPKLAPAVLAAAALVGQQVAARATRDALFLSHHDVERLPYAMAAAAVLSLAAVVASSRAMARWPPARVVPAALAASAVLLVLEWLLSMVSAPAAAVALYLHVAVFGATLVSGFWLLMGERYDPHSAKRALGPVGAGANAGAVVGGLIAWYAGRQMGMTAMLPVLAALTGLCWMGVRRVGASPALPVLMPAGPAPSGTRVLRDVPYLRGVAVLVALGAFAEALLDYVLSAQAVERFAGGPRLMAFFAAFHTGVALAAAALLAVAAGPALRHLGIAGTVALRPAAAGAGALVAWLAPGLLTAVAARAAEAVMRNSLFRTAYELLFIPVPAAHKRPVKAILDVGLDRVGTVLGSLVVMAVLAAGAPATIVLPALTLAVGAVTVAVALRLQRGYVASLAASLRSGAVTLDGDEMADADTRFTVAQTQVGLDRHSLLRDIEEHRRAAETGPAAGQQDAAPASRAEGTPAGDRLLMAAADLRSGDPGRIRRVLGSTLDPALVGHVVPLLAKDEIAGQAQRALRAVSIRATGQLIDAMIDDRRPAVVRRRLAPVLSAAATQRAADGLVLGLSDEALEVRARCARSLARLRRDLPGAVLPQDVLLGHALRELSRPDAGGHGLRHVFVLLGLAGDTEAMRIASHAVHSDAPGVRGTALEYLENVVPDPVRAPLMRRLGVDQPRRGAPRAETRDELLKTAVHLAIAEDKPEEL